MPQPPTTPHRKIAIQNQLSPSKRHSRLGFGLGNIINRPVWIVTRRTKIGTETTESVICAQATFAGATTAVSQSTAANRLEPAVYEFLLNGSPGSSVFVVIDRQHTKNGKDYVDKVVGAYNSLSEALQMTKNSIYVIHKLVNAPERNFQDQGTMELGGGCIFLVEEYPISKILSFMDNPPVVYL